MDFLFCDFFLFDVHPLVSGGDGTVLIPGAKNLCRFFSVQIFHLCVFSGWSVGFHIFVDDVLKIHNL